MSFVKAGDGTHFVGSPFEAKPGKKQIGEVAAK